MHEAPRGESWNVRPHVSLWWSVGSLSNLKLFNTPFFFIWKEHECQQRYLQIIWHDSSWILQKINPDNEKKWQRLQLQIATERLLILKNMWLWLFSPEHGAENVDSWEAHGIKMTNHSSTTDTEVNNKTPSPCPAILMLRKPNICKAFCAEIVIHEKCKSSQIVHQENMVQIIQQLWLKEECPL